MENKEKKWIDDVVVQDEIDRYKIDGKSFIDDDLIWEQINKAKNPDKKYIKEIIQKSLRIERLDPEEMAALIHCDDPELYQEMRDAALVIKEKVYGRRCVTFAPLYVSNYCVNNCEYCGYRTDNTSIDRKRLNKEELTREIEALVDEGHKRLIMVYGEHPASDYEYIKDTLETAYSVKRKPSGEIRRVNVNMAPLSIERLKPLQEVGIGTYQIFMETYHHETYAKVHPVGTLKGNYDWRLYGLHRCMDAGIDDVAPGILLGLYDWRFDAMAMLYHTIDLENRYDGVGPHTLSFPRLEPALDTPFAEQSPYMVSDEEFEKVVTVLRLAVPYCGMILTAREPQEVREKVLKLGITQLDFGSNIGVGSYAKGNFDPTRQQFMLNDTRSLDEGIRWLASEGKLPSFCTAGYRCGRTGSYFMNIAKKGKVHQMCMPNAILTFTEYLLDYASEETKEVGIKLVKKEIELMEPGAKKAIKGLLDKIYEGERDIYV
ncbi:MAG: [FeFe] hydrogenase H-cluster radical SAM maturase HydG [Candidatus Kapabacteria bacterium]|jgi:2-iminoacetate synthase|nr:[FeFe] hydrogenase H-cluster radical SAM maturase HydG [Candidatus Kapabacteria bacterium]